MLDPARARASLSLIRGSRHEHLLLGKLGYLYNLPSSAALLKPHRPEFDIDQTLEIQVKTVKKSTDKFCLVEWSKSQSSILVQIFEIPEMSETIKESHVTSIHGVNFHFSNIVIATLQSAQHLQICQLDNTFLIIIKIWQVYFPINRTSLKAIVLISTDHNQMWLI